MKRLGQIIGILAVAVLLVQCDGNKISKSAPNIIFIVTDDQGYADLSAYDHVSENCSTPNMDRIAKHGVLFDQCYVSGPVCSPSRAGLHTGMYQERWDCGMGWRPGLPTNVSTIAEVLKEYGYVTGRIGKSDYGMNYHNPEAREFPTEHGYDEFMGFSAHAHDYFLLDEEIEKATPDPHGESESLGRLFRNKEKVGFKDRYSTDLYTDEAIDFVCEHKDEPFFLDLAYNAVHELIHEVPDAYLKKWDVRKVPDYDLSYGTYAQYYWDFTQVGKISDEEKRKLYLANLNCLDDNIGRLLDTLESMDILENTFVVFISDNGGEPLTGANNLPLSGSKYTMHEGGIRVPFMLSWPGKLPEGKLYRHRVSALDVFPTVMEAVGLKTDDMGLDGSSLLRPVAEDYKSESAEEPLCFQFGRQWCIIDGDWKLVFAEDYNPDYRPITSQIQLGANSGVLALYNLKDDIGERKNLIEEESERAAVMQKKFDAWKLEMQEDHRNYEFYNGIREKLVVNEDSVYQEMHSFGASDSWRCQFVGENWPEEKKSKIADLLFSMDVDADGNPEGIGLSNWRFYLGAGSYEQGDVSDIRNVWRRSECFMDAEGNYDWTKYKGQRWFLNEAKDRGVPFFTAYTISPPVFFTKNGLAHAAKGDLGFNLKSEHYGDYADYLVNVLEHFEQEEGVRFHYLSPFNEPQWAWDQSNQEGTPARNEELFSYVKLLSERMSLKGLETKLLVGEAGDLGYLYEKKGSNNNGDQINAFFNPSSEIYMGDLENMEYAITSHSYFTTWPLKAQIDHRLKLAERMKEINPDLDFHQTEFCILEKSQEIGRGWGRDLGMPTALYVARVIHSDLTIANARSWEWWTALSQFDFKDGLIHLDDGKGNGVRNDISALNDSLRFDGEISETKLLWALGNYSRFVRPGMHRVDVHFTKERSLLKQAKDLQVSAYKNMESGELVMVFVNHKEEAKRVSLEGIASASGELYVTDKNRSLGRIEVDTERLVIPARSVSTLVLK